MTELQRTTPVAGQANGGAIEMVQGDYNPTVQELCSGYGQYHSPTAKKNPRPLVTVTLADIEAMAAEPPSVAKDSAQWVIPSTLLSRSHSEHRLQGNYSALWADIDEPEGVTFAALVEVAERIIPGSFIAYTSRSATEQAQKARLIIPLSEPVSGGVWLTLQKILNDKLQEAGITPDRVTERTGQLCYLPNRGDFYQHHIEKCEWLGNLSPDSWADELAAEAEREAEEAAAKRAQAEQAKLKPKPVNLSGYDAGIIDKVNAAFEMEGELQARNIRRIGDRFLSPQSETGSAGIVLLERDGKTVAFSHHGPADPLSNLNHDGHALDMFDVICVLDYAGDVSRAVGDLANKVDPDGQKQRQRDHMAALDAEKAAAEFKAETEADPAAMTAVDLFNALKLPPFPLHLLPRAIADYAQDQGELIGVDPAVIAVAAIGAAAACIDDRLEIQPKRHDPGWREQARLWVGIIGDPSAKKSPGISKAMGPLFKIDQQWREESARAHAEWLEACDNTPKGEQEPPAPIGQRLILNDATVEKMGDILSKCHPRGILSYQDELSGWLASMDAYKNGAGGKDKAAWLEAYNGGPKAIDRVARGSIFVENWSACVIGGIQPSVVQAYAHNTNHDGMLQRFVLVQAGEARLGADRRPDIEAKERYYSLMRQLSETVAVGDCVVTLSEEAHKAREALDERLHRITRSHPNKYLVAALGKWNGLFARLLLTFHCIECGTALEHPTFREVQGDTARRVADLMWKTLFPHAVAFYNGLDPVEDTARELAGLLLARSWERFTVKRDLNRHWHTSRKLKPWELEETLDRLEAFGWIFPAPGHLNEKGKPAAYLVNPGIHERFKERAEEERARRKEVAAAMAELKTGS